MHGGSTLYAFYPLTRLFHILFMLFMMRMRGYLEIM